MAGHEGPRGFGPQDKWPYRDSGPSGSSDTEAGLARLAALGNVGECDLPSRQGEGDTPQGDRAPTAAELRESLREITNSTKPSEPTGPRNRDQILAALQGGAGTHEASVSSLGTAEVPPTVAEINTKAVEEESNRAIDPDAIQKIVGGIHKSLEGVNSYFLEKAATIVGTAAHQDAVVLESMHKQYNELGQ